ncbi:hypothetical protein TWF481_003193 [Arthrobotrys musiformis]|uniref:Helitron helicase-like domain-containing protein n=1 Tax=Arthrobotrys musiformis TaxID=47236 RepID=A0AAV9VPK7_9PEZI
MTSGSQSRSKRYWKDHSIQFSWAELDGNRRREPLKDGPRIRMEFTSRRLDGYDRNYKERFFDEGRIQFPDTTSPSSDTIRLAFKPSSLQTFLVERNPTLVVFFDCDLNTAEFKIERKSRRSSLYFDAVTGRKLDSIGRILGQDFVKHKTVILGLGRYPMSNLETFIKTFRLYDAADPIDGNRNPAALALIQRKLENMGITNFDKYFPHQAEVAEESAQYRVLMGTCARQNIENGQQIAKLFRTGSGSQVPPITHPATYKTMTLFTDSTLHTIAMCKAWDARKRFGPIMFFFERFPEGRIPREGAFEMNLADWEDLYGPTVGEELNGVNDFVERTRSDLREALESSESKFDGRKIRKLHEGTFNNQHEEMMNELWNRNLHRKLMYEGMSIQTYDWGLEEVDYEKLAKCRLAALRPSRKQLTSLRIRRWTRDGESRYYNVSVNGYGESVSAWITGMLKRKTRFDFYPYLLDRMNVEQCFLWTYLNNEVPPNVAIVIKTVLLQKKREEAINLAKKRDESGRLSRELVKLTIEKSCEELLKRVGSLHEMKLQDPDTSRKSFCASFSRP